MLDENHIQPEHQPDRPNHKPVDSLMIDDILDMKKYHKWLGQTKIIENIKDDNLQNDSQSRLYDLMTSFIILP